MNPVVDGWVQYGKGCKSESALVIDRTDARDGLIGMVCDMH